MVIIERRFECREYAITDCVNATKDCKTFFKDDAENSDMWCSIFPDELDQRNKAVYVNPDLLADWSKIYEGRSERWRLMRVGIQDGTLVLSFADLANPIIYGGSVHGYPRQDITFRNYQGDFSVSTNRDECEATHEFSFPFTPEYHTDGGKIIATFKEWRGGEKSCHSSNIITFINGRQYLTQTIFGY